MGQVLLDMAISLDGYVGGPDGADIGLYEWYFDPSDASRPVVEELVATSGAIVLGRGAFGDGDWGDTPYQVPHFVVTHRPVNPSEGLDVRVVSDGVAAAVAQAREAAGDRYATVGGGADIARQCLAAGLVDEVQLHVVPLLAGDGVRLFDGAGPAVPLDRLRVVDAPNVTHVRYAVRRG